MTTRYVVAVIPAEFVRPLQEQLQALGVGGMTLTHVKGFGEYKNLYSDDWLTEHVKIEMFVQTAMVKPLLAVLVKGSQLAGPGAGIAAVLKAEAFVHLRTGTEDLAQSEAGGTP